jgi:hypothetical protein
MLSYPFVADLTSCGPKNDPFECVAETYRTGESCDAAGDFFFRVLDKRRIPSRDTFRGSMGDVPSHVWVWLDESGNRITPPTGLKRVQLATESDYVRIVRGWERASSAV